MTKNCKFETPCGMCELFERPCKDVCGTPKNDRFKPQINPLQMMDSSMDLIKIHKLPTHNIKTGELEY